MGIKLYPHQIEVLNITKYHDRVAYYLDMGLGKTHTGSEKMMQLGAKVNLVVCQKSKVDDWVEHFRNNYDCTVEDLTNVKQKDFDKYIHLCDIIPHTIVLIINYDLVWRRPELLQLIDFTLLLDESSLIQSETAKRTKFVMKLKPKNIILLSGTPTGGKYERLYSQLKLLGMKLSKSAYWNTYVNYKIDRSQGFPITTIFGYKNVDRLKRKMRELGCVFLKTEEVMNLPDQIDTNIKIDSSKEYREFRKDCIVSVNVYGELTEKQQAQEPYKFRDFDKKTYYHSIKLVGDTTLTKMLYERQLCGQYSREKLSTFRDLLESTNDRLIVFYNFTSELNMLKEITLEYTDHISEVNGPCKDLKAYEEYDDSVTFIQYQAGAMGLNLQKSCRICYFTPPLSSELFEQSKKRIHRIGQNKPCFYYYMICKGSIEEKIYKTLAMRRDYTNKLFESEA